MNYLSKLLKKLLILIISAFAWSVSSADTVSEVEPVDNSYEQTKSLDEEDEWEFRLAPLYLWGMSMKGDVGVGPVTAPVDLSFTDDVLSNLELVFTFHFEAQKGDWSFFADFSHVNLGPSTELVAPGPMSKNLTVDTDFTNEIFEMGAAYRIIDDRAYALELLGGFRYMGVDVKSNFAYGPEIMHVKEEWADGFGGIRFIGKISDSWRIIFRGDVGAGGSDLVWNTLALIDYRFHENVSFAFGYRAMGYDYNNRSLGPSHFEYDAIMQGPLGGFNIIW